MDQPQNITLTVLSCLNNDTLTIEQLFNAVARYIPDATRASVAYTLGHLAHENRVTTLVRICGPWSLGSGPVRLVTSERETAVMKLISESPGTLEGRTPTLDAHSQVAGVSPFSQGQLQVAQPTLIWLFSGCENGWSSPL